MKRMMKILAERKESMNFTDEKAPINDAVDLLLRDSSESSEKQSPPLDSISGNIIEMMIPGDETMVTGITLAVKFLSDSPVALQKLVVRKLTLNEKKKKKVFNFELGRGFYIESSKSFCGLPSFNVYK